ncbi:MAG TPA: 5,6-dimethylbenzimidazole synthase [Candidatus Acidoferrales bacterium]|nr:5,6-dimethylbenzimidazole synthase [Candidatus Acidoferrales bacterium]
MSRGHRFSDDEVRGVYRAIYERRDVRSSFLADPLPDDVLERLLDAAHHAPSVGFMQPSRFIVIKDLAIRTAVHHNFERANLAAAQRYEGSRATQYRNLKLAGILEAPVNVCVVCESETSRGAGLGRQTIPETALYSTVCAVENLWLAARAEGIGVGWVSILDPQALRATLGIPESATAVAYLCLGYVSSFASDPDLERYGWEERASLEEVIFTDRFGQIGSKRR